MGEPLRAAPIEAPPQPSAITFHVEKSPVSVIRSEGMDLLARHWEEVATHQHVQVLDPDWPVYEAMERLGKLWVLTARDRGVLIGYVVMMLSRHLHYRTLLVATDDIRFLHPDYRRGWTGYRMIVMTEKAMAALGVRKCVLRTKFLLDHGKLFERRRFVKEDIVYSKILEG
jgi:GNAT superfamily N-acetyltransferase